MGKTRFVLLFMLLCAVCPASQISFQVVQHDESAGGKVGEQSLLVEDGLLTGFFDSGFIVTNSPAAVSSSAAQDESLWKIGFDDAADGCSDYFVQVRLYFRPDQDSAGKTSPVLNDIEYSVVSVATGRRTSGKSAVEPEYERLLRKKNRNSSGDGLFAGLVADIKKAIKRNPKDGQI